MADKPLTNAINALTAYANDVTGESDTTLSDAVHTLTEGYGQGGGNIENGIVFTGFDSSGKPTSADIYGDVPPYAFGVYQSNGVGTSLNSVSFKGAIQKIGAGAFQKTAITSITIPDSVDSIGTQCFRGNTALANYTHENARSLYAYGGGAVSALYGLSHLETMQLGAVGKPVTALYKQAFTNSSIPSTAIITIYCTGNNVDAFLTACRDQLTTQTIVFKASEATTYGGTSYAAGDTITV